jgi:RNA polymerase sigma-70 factor (ECF subfamily)
MAEDRGASVHATTLLALYDDAVGEVFRYLHARCRDRTVAEDLTADTFLAAVGQVQRDAVDEVTVAWLIGIARHKLVDHWRRTARRPRTTELDEDAIAGTAAPAPAGRGGFNGDEVWDAVLDRQRVGAVMAELGPHHRSALVLRYYDGLPVPEVAHQLGRTVEATETLLVRARRRFRSIYERDEVSR